jgi:hypothetical protein
MAPAAAAAGAHSPDAVAVGMVSVGAAVDNVIVSVAHVLSGMGLDTLPAALCSVGILAWVVPSGLTAPFVLFAFLERRPAHPTHSFHDHDRWSRGFVWVEVAEILTWAERGMPLNEQCRTPLWPNLDRERTAPGLIYPDVRREEYTNDRDEVLRIAWKRPDR